MTLNQFHPLLVLTTHVLPQYPLQHYSHISYTVFYTATFRQLFNISGSDQKKNYRLKETRRQYDGLRLLRTRYKSDKGARFIRSPNAQHLTSRLMELLSNLLTNFMVLTSILQNRHDLDEVFRALRLWFKNFNSGLQCTQYTPPARSPAFPVNHHSAHQTTPELRINYCNFRSLKILRICFQIPTIYLGTPWINRWHSR
jgi:hypothetical protein